MLETIKSAVFAYEGLGMYRFMFWTSLLFFVYVYKEKLHTRVIAFWCGIGLLIIGVFCWSMVPDSFFKTIPDYRFFDIIPLVILFAYSGTHLVCLGNKIWKKVVLFFGIILILEASNQCIFTSELYEAPHRTDKLDPEVIEICEFLLSEDETPFIIAPNEMIVQISLYTTQVDFYYGIETIETIPDWYHMEVDILRQNAHNDITYGWNYSSYAVTIYGSVYEVDYLILNKSEESLAYAEHFNYKQIFETENYYVVKSGE